MGGHRVVQHTGSKRGLRKRGSKRGSSSSSLLHFISTLVLLLLTWRYVLLYVAFCIGVIVIVNVGNNCNGKIHNNSGF
jgi:hypothetical protein